MKWRSIKKWNSLGLIAMVCSLFSFVIPNNNAYAATMPPTSPSYYGTANTTTSYNAGCSLGTDDKNSGFSGYKYVIISYGAPQYNGTNYGASIFGSGFYTTRQIADAVDQFAKGYYICTGSNTAAKIIIGVGTSNSKAASYSIFTQGSTVVKNHGSTWSAMVSQIASELISNGWSSQTSVQGAIDIEPNFYGSKTLTRTWVDGYSASLSNNFVNFGAADGCPTSGTGTCDNGWTLDDMYYVSWGNAKALAFPEIYSTTESTLSNGTVTDTNAKQWYNISKQAVNAGSSKISFTGALSQYTACSQVGGCSGTDATPLKSWWYLYNALNADTQTASTPVYSSDIRWM